MVDDPTNLRIQPIVPRTQVAAALVAWLEGEKRVVTTASTLFLALRRLYAPENRRKLYLRSDAPTVDDLRRVTTNLLNTRGIERDPDYGRSVYRVPSAGESSADEACALANPFGYISHLSAMQRWGLTDRRPDALHLTMPPASAARSLVEQRMEADFGVPFAEIPSDWMVKLHFIRHPETVRGRRIAVYETKHPGQWLQVRDANARLATVGQTFVDMLERPQYCGGMVHVVDVWRAHAGTHRDEIIAAVDATAIPIAKVRAGYLFDVVLESGNDPRIQGWVTFAQSGGSRVLDPTKDFIANYSEKWMMSINV